MGKDDFTREHFGEDIKLDSNIKKQTKNFDKLNERSRIVNEKKREKIMRETDKQAEKLRRKEIKELNKKIKENDGLIEKDGRIIYMEKQKYKKLEKPKEIKKRPDWTKKETLWQKIKKTIFKKQKKQKIKKRVRRRARDTFLHRFIKWMKTSVFSKIASLFYKPANVVDEKDMQNSVTVPNPNQNKNKQPNLSQKEVETILANEVKQLFAAPITEQVMQLGAPEENIIDAYKEYLQKNGANDNKDFENMMGYAIFRLMNNEPVTEKNLSDFVSYATGQNCIYNTEDKTFDVYMDGGIAKIAHNGEITIPETINIDGQETSNSLSMENVLSNEGIKGVSECLYNADRTVDLILTEQKISDKELNIVKDYVKSHPEVADMLPALEAIEKKITQPEAMVMLNKTIARLSYIDTIDPNTNKRVPLNAKDVMRYGFEAPIKVIPNMETPSNYKVYLAALQSSLMNNSSIENASLMANAFVVDKGIGNVDVITDGTKIGIIMNHINEMNRMGKMPAEQVAIIHAYNDCKDEKAMEFATMQINKEIQKGTMTQDIVNMPIIKSFDPIDFAKVMSQEVEGKSALEFANEYRTNEKTTLNTYIEAFRLMTQEEKSTVCQYMGDKAENLTAIIEEIDSQSQGDAVLSNKSMPESKEILAIPAPTKTERDESMAGTFDINEEDIDIG